MEVSVVANESNKEQNRKKFKDDTRKKISVMQVIIYGLKMHIKILPFLFILINIIGIFSGFLQGFTTYITQILFDSIADILITDAPIYTAYYFVAALGLTYIFKEIFSGIHDFLSKIISSKMNGSMTMVLHDKISKIHPICFENTRLYDDIEKASKGSHVITNMVASTMHLICFYLPYFIFMGFYLHHLRPEFVFAIILVFVPVFISQFIRTGIEAKFEDKVAPIRREHSYYSNAIIDRSVFKETRILGAYKFFLSRFIETMNKLNIAEWNKAIQTNALQIIMNLMSAAGYVAVLFMLVSALLVGEISVGAFAAVFSSIGTMFAMMNRILKHHIGSIASNMGYAQNFIRLIEFPERGGENANPNFGKGIVTKNISFTYPNSEQKSIDCVSVKIKYREKIAIVGKNGAGKTTLVRLLIGLYTPSEGKVFLNGMDTENINSKSIYSGLSGVLQAYQRYQMTLADNVRISDFSDESPIYNAAKKAGIDIADTTTYPNGEQTMLSREFDGVDLSGGQWQRVAIARGLYRVHDVIILDEPTAAIDPLEEARIYKQFIEISRDKTAIIVTHRLGSTKIADRVLVMDKGRIVEEGSHYDLMKLQGLYTEMYALQASWYENNTIFD